MPFSYLPAGWTLSGIAITLSTNKQNITSTVFLILLILNEFFSEIINKIIIDFLMVFEDED